MLWKKNYIVFAKDEVRTTLVVTVEAFVIRSARSCSGDLAGMGACGGASPVTGIGVNSLDRIRRGKLPLDYQRSPVYLRLLFFFSDANKLDDPSLSSSLRLCECMMEQSTNHYCIGLRRHVPWACILCT